MIRKIIFLFVLTIMPYMLYTASFQTDSADDLAKNLSLYGIFSKAFTPSNVYNWWQGEPEPEQKEIIPEPKEIVSEQKEMVLEPTKQFEQTTEAQTPQQISSYQAEPVQHKAEPPQELTQEQLDENKETIQQIEQTVQETLKATIPDLSEDDNTSAMERVDVAVKEALNKVIAHAPEETRTNRIDTIQTTVKEALEQIVASNEEHATTVQEIEEVVRQALEKVIDQPAAQDKRKNIVEIAKDALKKTIASGKGNIAKHNNQEPLLEQEIPEEPEYDYDEQENSLPEEPEIPEDEEPLPGEKITALATVVETAQPIESSKKTLKKHPNLRVVSAKKLLAREKAKKRTPAITQ